MIKNNILNLESISVRFSPHGPDVVDDISFGLEKGEIVGIAGESGSGKTVSMLSILGLLPQAIVKGSVKFNGTELIGANNSILNKIRGKRIGLILQNPFTALDPMLNIGNQISKGLIADGCSMDKAKKEAINLLDEVGVPSPSQRIRDYPHQFSGGMRQRIVIAIALSQNPELLIADEPTTALDVRIQKQVMELIKRQCINRGMSLILITHDLGLISNYTDRVLMMYAGKIVEDSPSQKMFKDPLHPYSKGLLDCLPKLNDYNNDFLTTISGNPPQPNEFPSGCRFHPRCNYSKIDCQKDGHPPLIKYKWGRSGCIRVSELF